MKNVFLYAMMLFSVIIYAQAGINTKNPKTTLDIQAANPTNPDSKTGLAVPRVSVNPATGEEKGQLIFNTTLNKFQYWNGTSWQGIDSVQGGSSSIQSFLVETKSSNALTVSNSTTNPLEIPGLSQNLTLSKKSLVQFMANVNFKSQDSALSPKFILEITNLGNSTKQELNQVMQVYLSDGVIETVANLSLVSLKELDPGNYQVKVLAFYNNCCNFNFTYQTGGTNNVSNLATNVFN